MLKNTDTGSASNVHLSISPFPIQDQVTPETQGRHRFTATAAGWE